MFKPIQDQWLDQWAGRIHRSGLAVIALPLLEISRGLGFLFSQALLLIQPMLASVVDAQDISRYVAFLDDPAAIEELIERLERETESHG
jgi:hypothetical protein